MKQLLPVKKRETAKRFSVIKFYLTAPSHLGRIATHCCQKKKNELQLITILVIHLHPNKQCKPASLSQGATDGTLAATPGLPRLLSCPAARASCEPWLCSLAQAKYAWPRQRSPQTVKLESLCMVVRQSTRALILCYNLQ